VREVMRGQQGQDHCGPGDERASDDGGHVLMLARPATAFRALRQRGRGVRSPVGNGQRGRVRPWQSM
jgi:hypothetical protein